MRSGRDRSLLVVASFGLLLGVGISLARRREAVPVSAAPTGAPSIAPASVTGAWRRRSLAPVAHPDPASVLPPARARPYHVVASADGRKAYVSLAGSEAQPGQEVVVIDVPARREVARIAVGSQPYGLALHPGGRWLVVTNRFSNFLSVVDTTTDRVVAEIPALFYCEDLVFAADGATIYVSNFWKDQVLVVDVATPGGRAAGPLRGAVRDLGFDRAAFAGADDAPGVHAVLRGRCGTAHCHLYPTGGFVAGPDLDEAFRSATVHAFPGFPAESPLLRAVTAVRHGGLADATTGYHHAGGAVFSDPATDPDVARLRAWIAGGREGPGISVGGKPRDLALSADGRTLYVANTATLDVSVVDLATLRETRRIATRSPVNDLVEVDGRLILATLGVGSGHPKRHDAGREGTDRAAPGTEFTLLRDVTTGALLPLEAQRPLGPYDDVDGTAQEKFRDMTNDLVLLDPAATNVAAYAATEEFTRYTSDTFEALPGDAQGDVPPALMQVVGAFPEQIARRGDRLYVTMAGTFEVQEWRVDVRAAPAARLVPGRVFATGYQPTGIAVCGETLVIADRLGEAVTFVDLAAGGTTADLALGRLAAPYPADDFERAELYVQSAIFSADRDVSCVHCHYRDTSDGKKWSVTAVTGQGRDRSERAGGSREVPDLRALYHKVPMFVEGTLGMDESLGPMMEQAPLIAFTQPLPVGDFTGVFATAEAAPVLGTSAHALMSPTGKPFAHPTLRVADLVARRDAFFRGATAQVLGRPYDLRELQRIVGRYQAAEPRLLPNPEDPEDPMVRHGRALYESPEVGCAGCHPAPAFTDKQHARNQNASFPPLVGAGRRDLVHTLVSPSRVDALAGYRRAWDRSDDQGRIQERMGFFVAPSLHGLWARPPRLLHDGRAISVREVISAPGHPALRPLGFARLQAERPGLRELGLNERDGVTDTHGATSHLSVWDLECLRKYLLAIE